MDSAAKEMEDSNNDSVAQKSFLSPPKIRRSAFFEKRDSFVPQVPTENSDPESKQINEVDEKHYQHLKRYHDELLAENKEWKAEVIRRRNRYHEMKKQLECEPDPSEKAKTPYSLLSKEDLDFLKNRVDLSELINSQAELHKSVMQTKELYRKMQEIESDNDILDHCEKKLSEVTDYLLQNSTIQDKQQNSE